MRPLFCRAPAAHEGSFVSSDRNLQDTLHRSAWKAVPAKHRTSNFEDHLHGAMDLEGMHEEDDIRGRAVSAQQRDFLQEADRSRREQFNNRVRRAGMDTFCHSSADSFCSLPSLSRMRKKLQGSKRENRYSRVVSA